MEIIFFKSFVSLFVAIDALGVLPFLTGLTKALPQKDRQRLINKSVLAALAVGLIFTISGKAIFSFLGIEENDFRVAGGILLLVFAIRDLTTTEGHQGSPAPMRVGIVPIAVPLIMGPAALASLLVSAEEYSLAITLISLLSNLLIVWLLFSKAHLVVKLIGSETSDAIAKIFALLLAAIGVMLVRLGIKGMIQ